MFQAMWTVADRNGRLPDRPRRIKVECLPFDEHDIEGALSDLQAAGFIDRYQVSDEKFIEIVNFDKHQKPHPNEPAEHPANPHSFQVSYQSPIESRNGTNKSNPRARESVLAVSGKNLSSKGLDLKLEELRNLWPPERNFASDHNRQCEAIWQADRKGLLPDDLIESAQLYLDAHGFGPGNVGGCPNLSKWISDRRWTAPLPVKAGKTTEDFSEYDAGIEVA